MDLGSDLLFIGYVYMSRIFSYHQRLETKSGRREDETKEPFDDSRSSVHFSDESVSDESIGSEIFNLEAEEGTRHPIEWGNGERIS